jgi:ATP-binding cassette subfamily F protein uup
MLLVNGQSLSKSFGTKRLFQDLSISVFSGDRIGLIGKNGSGKSTFLKILAGLETADEGALSPRRGLRVGYLPQTCDFPDKKPIDILIQALAHDHDTPDYEKERLAETWMSKLGFTGLEPSAARLSGGWKKRLMLAKEMLLAPDLLLLDEPTNHLDLEGIVWLEKFLMKEAPTYILVSHDRYFLQHATNRIIEIDSTYPKGLFAIDGSYLNFLEKKELFLAGQLEQERSLASKARRELDWLRTSPKARTSKSKSRVDQAHELLDDLADVRKRNTQKKADINFTESDRETRKLLVAKNIAKSIDGRVLFKGLDFTLSPGSRIGLMGPNGSGKTTLLKILAEELSPDQGTIKRADALKTVYFDQHRNQLPDNMSLREALCPNGDFVLFRGQSIHVNGWCKRFLFSPDLLDLPLGTLSGGERARIAIAHLMLQPADLLLLDEPTNDLDIPTLETLENSLIDFPGAVVLITHDRCMLDRICNSLIALGDPLQTEIFADYTQWEAAQKKQAPAPIKEKEVVPQQQPRPSKAKLTYAEKKEYDQMEGKIQKLEDEMKELSLQFENPEVAQNSKLLTELSTAIKLVETQLEQLYLRWEALEHKQQ